MKVLLVYFTVSFILTLFLLYFCSKFIKKENTKNFILKLTAILTLIIHLSSLWVDFFNTGKAEITDVMILPIYPCNLVMWMLIIAAYIENKNSSVFNMLADFIFYVGTFCGIIGIVVNENYLSNQNLFDWDIFKGLLSHSTMLFGCLYLYVMKYVRVNTFTNLAHVVVGLLIFIVDGILINTLFHFFELSSVNAMYLQEAPFPNMPFINTLTIGIAGVIVVFIMSTILEIINLPLEKRWYKNLKKNEGEENARYTN